MKTLSCLTLVSLSLTLSSQAQTSSSAPAASASAPQDTPWSIVSRDANSRVHQRTTYEQDPSGQWIPTIHSFTEIGSGMCYQQNGQWVDSVEEIDPAPTGGAQAVQLQQKVTFPYDIYNGVIQVVTPDGEQLQSRPVGVSFFDGTNSVLIAELTNSIGQIISSNQIIYTNAFTDFPADLLISCRKSGLECDLILRSQIPDPQAYGLSASSTRLELLTEFFGTPDPEQTPDNPLAGLSDVTLGFGKMKMVRGRAFKIGSSDGAAASHMGGVPVAKSWTQLSGRTFLIEEVSYPLIGQQLQALPPLAAAGVSTSMDSALHKVSASRLLPLARAVQPGTKAMKIAKATLPPKNGVVLDYVLLNGNTNAFTFSGNSTYLISDIFNGYGLTTFESGTVIKFDTTKSDSSVQLWGNVNFKTDSYRPVVFTSCNDNTVGESTYKSGAPMYYYEPLYINASGQDVVMQNVRISYAVWGLHPYGENFTLNNAQFINCYSNAFYPEYVTARLNNVLMANVGSAFGGNNYTVAACNMTIAGCGQLATASGSPSSNSVAFTNCLLDYITNTGPVSITNDHTQTLSNQIFQTVGAGSYYLATDSPYRNVGTTNIDPNLLATLQQTTTYPPIVYSNVYFSNSITLGPQAQRDYDTPDLGYHYDPLDYCFGGVVVQSNLTFTAGTAVGWFELPGSGGPGFGLQMSGAGTVNFNGLATAPCTLARYDAVQEGGNGLWIDKGWLAAVTPDSGNSGIATSTANFTRFSELASDPNYFRDYSSGVGIVANNCEFYSGMSIPYWAVFEFTNCLFQTMGLGIHGSSSSVFAMRNCTLREIPLDIEHSGTTWQVWIENCAFDASTIAAMDDNSAGATNITYCAYNAFLNGAQRLVVTNVNDQVISNFSWQPGPLGNYYQLSTNLIDNGSVTAGLVGLYHFTIQTNQTVEGNSPVDIGYHYVALYSNGNPLDTNGDGIPDYLEDANGNGLVDSGEIGWNINGDLGLQVIITRPKNNSLIP